MYLLQDNKRQLLPDVADFIEQLNGLGTHPLARVRGLFDIQSDLFVARAPGRLDLMGGIADYSGSLVLQMPIREATLAAVQKDASRRITVVSGGSDREGEAAISVVPLSALEQGGRPVAYETARAYFQREPAYAWSAYIAGAFLVLMREKGVEFPHGARIFIHSDVPEGKGVSSSAAVEVATMTALAALMGISIAPREMALLCQLVENRVVGAPCGVMDQMTAVCGEANQLLSLFCQPAEIQEPVAIAEGLSVWGIDSGIRHAVSGSDYTSVRVGAFMGYRMLLEMGGVVESWMRPDTIADTRWDGYLANMSPSEFAQSFARHIPETMKGDDFLHRYGGTTDTVTRVEPDRLYAVRQPTAHPIYEHFRVRTFARLLQDDVLANATLLGECMYQSHASYSECGLGSTGTDELVRLARAFGPEEGIYGAKITGGGSGGTVAILARHDAESAVRAIASQYEQSSGKQPYVFQGSSPGAAAHGVVRLVCKAP